MVAITIYIQEEKPITKGKKKTKKRKRMLEKVGESKEKNDKNKMKRF